MRECLFVYWSFFGGAFFVLRPYRAQAVTLMLLVVSFFAVRLSIDIESPLAHYASIICQ